jgi:HlyD family secretion protein
MGRKGRRWIVAGTIVGMAGVVAGLAWSRRQPENELQGFAWGNGRIEATEVEIATKRSARIREVLVDEGDTVEAGQILARMDDQDLEAAVREAEARLNEEREALNHAAAMVAERQSVLDLAEKQLRRSEQLRIKGYVASQTLDEDRSRKETAAATLRAARSQVVRTEASIRAAEASVRRLEIDRADDVLTAPVAGRILYRLAEPGEILPAGGRVLTLLQLSDSYMTIFLSAHDAGRVRIGAEARIVLDARPEDTIPAILTFVSPNAQFTPKEVETRNEREKLMFRAKVKVDWNAREGNVLDLKTGLPGVAYIRIEPNAAWPMQRPARPA